MLTVISIILWCVALPMIKHGGRKMTTISKIGCAIGIVATIFTILWLMVVLKLAILWAWVNLP